MQNSDLRKDLQDILDALKNIASKGFNAVSTPNTSEPSEDEFEAAILFSLTAEPLTITELVSAISLQSAGRFNPSTGKTLELLGKLTENKFVSKKVESERRLFAITDKGKRRLAELKESADAQADDSPEADESTGRSDCKTGDNSKAKLLKSSGALAQTVSQLTHFASSKQQTEAAELISQVNKKLHAILAETD
jgi:DNA-binding PadR family transcriptional regulator